MPDTYFTSSPHWTVFIVPYFFIGGIAGGCYFLATVLSWLGNEGDEEVARLGYLAAFVGVVVSGLLLIVDLGQPLRFWHMLLQAQRFPLPMLKAWSPMSIGSWALFFFGMFATLSAAGVLAHSGRLRFRPAAMLYTGLPGRVISFIGAAFGFFIAGYTGVLLSVTNRPIWADTTWLGVLFLVSSASKAAATLILLARWQMNVGAEHPTVRWLAWFDGWVLVAELLLLVIFVASLGEVARVWLSWRGLVLFVFVVLLGILIPLAMHFRPGWVTGSWRGRPALTGAVLVLVGGFFLRLVTILGSETIHAPHTGIPNPITGMWP